MINKIETLICEPFEKLVPLEDNMTTEQRELFLIISGMPEEEDGLSKESLDNLKKSNFLNVEQIEKLFTVTLCFRTKVWLTYLCGPNKAMLFIYMAYIQYKAKKANVFEVNFRWFCEKLFPNGFPEESSIYQLFKGVSMVVEAPQNFASIQWTPQDIEDYKEAKKELRQPLSEALKSKSTSTETKKFSAMDLLKNKSFMNNFK